MRLLRAVLLVPAVLLAACGGGVWIGGGWGDDDDLDVALTVSAPEAAPGEVLRLAAAASGGWPVVSVSFFRLDGDTRVLLARDRDRPFEAPLTVPSDGRRSVEVFAEALDEGGWTARSDIVSVTVR